MIKLYYEIFIFQPIDWDLAIESYEPDRSVGPVEWAKPGYDAAVAILKSFVDERLKLYANKRNDPTQNAISNLSPWIRFGKHLFLTNLWHDKASFREGGNLIWNLQRVSPSRR